MTGLGVVDRLKRVVTRSRDDFETRGWVERLLVNETGELTPTEEYVHRYGLARRIRAGELERTPEVPGGWSPALERPFATDADAGVVADALARLSDRGLIERVPADGAGEAERTYWRLTDAGRQEQNRLVRAYRRELERLQVEYGMTTDW